MTSRNLTSLLPMREDEKISRDARWSDRLHRLVFGAIGWPWLLCSLWGGTQSSKRSLLARVGLEDDSLPHLGSWKADTGFLHRIVDAVEELRPRNVVELGAGASTLICAKALEHNGGGRLFSYDQHSGFVEATSRWLEEEGARAEVRHAPLSASGSEWPGSWYELSDIPETVDLLIIDGPPWTIHPFVRGAADCLFERLSPGGIVLLDDAARPGERVVARRWTRKWPQMQFRRLPGSSKGTLIGRRAQQSAEILPFSAHRRHGSGGSKWQRAAAMAALLGTGWVANDVTAEFVAPAHAAAFLDEADASHTASLVRHRMMSQPESLRLDRAEIASMTGLALPHLPSDWRLSDVQVFPSDLGLAVTLFVTTGEGEEISIFAARADASAGEFPLVQQRRGRSIAYWEEGEFAYAITGETQSSYLLAIASRLAGAFQHKAVAGPQASSENENSARTPGQPDGARRQGAVQE